ncbi:zinc finger protein 91-like [Teleopsis dalmanni]|uniref:zinc finger protein 91-like n=1 Tax=Teleopsis dalmanni TaxID=139649 RepID=UPI000D32AE70|nr:zinc finger protein 91-like [Teleopsis dalmanni]
MEKWIICRICLKPSANMTEIFRKNNNEENIVEDIKECGGIVLNNEDDLPKKICSKCLKLLKISQKFRKLCQISEQKLGVQQQELQNITDIKNVSSKPNEAESEDEPIIVSAKIKEEPNADDTVKETYEIIVSDYMTEMYVGETDVGCELDNMPSEDDEFLQEETNYTTEASYLASNSNDYEPYDESQSSDYGLEQNSDIINRTVSETELQITSVQVMPTTFKKKISKENKSETGSTQKTPAKRKQALKSYPAHICCHCGNIYNEKSKLTAHMKYHRKDKPHECEICHKRFTHTPQLARHMNSHTGNRPFKCKYCSAAFTDPSTKIKHERIHTNERPYSCTICNKSFAYSNVLKVHMMMHSGEKPFSCETCGKKFAQVHHKKAHERTHKKGILFICPDDMD